jgi:asparagine synthase (glutamine-hydrolysing)
MCGILGYISKNNNIKFTEFEKSLSRLSLRGPDGQGYSENILKNNSVHVRLGHRRLAIIDLSNAGKQPMSDRTGMYEIIFNGEIYNYKAIKRKLQEKGYVFKSNSDTEVLLYGYIEYGKKILRDIEGMFAFAIYDKLNNIIFCARDHFGKKPFYYLFDNDQFIFASELKAISSFKSLKLNIDLSSINKFLFYGYIPSNHTIYRNIHKLPPASYQIFDITSWKLHSQKRYWDINRIEVNSNISETEALMSLDSLLESSVKKRLISDVPLGVFLSGGVDSSLIAAYMKKLTQDVTSFTVNYSNYKNDETQFAEKVGEFLDIKTHFREFKDLKVKKYFQEITEYMDEPMADPAILPLYFIAKAAKSQITVALSGDGGDEIFGGYPKYIAQIAAERYKIFKPLVSVADYFINNSSLKKFNTGVSLPFHIRQFLYGSGSFLPNEVSKLIGKKVNLDEIFEDAKVYDDKFKDKDIINRSLYLDSRIQLPDWYMVKGDRATMAASLEMRNPFLDKSLVEYAFTLKGSFKIKGIETKYLLKKLASKYLPREVIYRKKRGFAVPLDHWLINILKINTYTPKSKFMKKNFNQDFINYLKININETNDIKYKLYRLYILDNYLYTHE